jgi:DNA mismatch endonuclease (patch repair protein)
VSRTFDNVDPKRSRIMGAIRGKDTSPELAVRRWLHAHGYRFRLHQRKLPGTPDVVLPKHHTAIQVRGCFWHSHDCGKTRVPLSRKEYWIPKLSRNVERDAEKDAALTALGYSVQVVWECETRTTETLDRRMWRLIKTFAPHKR